MAVRGALERLHPADLQQPQAKLLGGERGGVLLASERLPRQSTSVPPTRSSGAAYSSTTGWAASARATTASLRSHALQPLLGPRVHDLRILDLRRSAQARQELALAPVALDQADSRVR